MRFKLLTLFTFIFSSALAQNETGKSSFYENLAPHSPSVGSFGSYGNIPVDEYVGVPSLQIPLVTLNSYQLLLPISINYFSTGVQVEQVAGPEGMNWTLLAGGYISRDMKGLPDETSNGFLNKGEDLINFTDAISEDDKKTLISNVQENKWDSQPDYFIYNFNNYAGKFVFDNNGSIQSIPKNNFKIDNTITDGKISKFEIITLDGTKYIFDVVEETRLSKLSYKLAKSHNKLQNRQDVYYLESVEGNHFSSNPDDINETVIGGDFFNSKWYLSKIESPTNDEIDFTYTKGAQVSYVSAPKITAVSTITTCDEHLHYYQGSNNYDVEGFTGYFVANTTHDYLSKPSGNYCMDILNAPYSYEDWDLSYRIDAAPTMSTFVVQSLTKVNQKHLSSIITKSGNSIDFTYSQGRNDLPGGWKLESLTHYSQGVLNKSYRFDYSVYSSRAINGINDPMSISEYCAYNFNFNSSSSINANELVNKVDKFKSIGNKREMLLDYIYEGLKHYNYKRMFLSNISQTTQNDNEIVKYSFDYDHPTFLPRRTSLLYGRYGYFRSIFRNEVLTHQGYDNEMNVVFGYPSTTNKPFNTLEYDTPNRNEKTNYGLLKKVTFPTGGYTEFSYRAHVYEETIDDPINRDFRQAGALLSKTESVGADGLKKIKQYLYIDTHLIAPKPVYKSYHSFKVDDGKYATYEVRSSYSQIPSQKSRGSVLANYEVKVIGIDENYKSMGYENYKFRKASNQRTPVLAIPSYEDEDGNEIVESFNIFPFPTTSDFDFKRGILTEKSVYANNESGPQLIKRVSSTHKIDVNNNVKVMGLIGGTYEREADTETKVSFWYGKYEVSDNKLRYNYGLYEVNSSPLFLENTTKETFDLESNSIREIIDITPVEDFPELIREKIVTGPDGSKIKTVYTYPIDIFNSAIPIYSMGGQLRAVFELLNDNKINAPLETKVFYKANNASAFKIIGATAVIYIMAGETALPYKLLKANLEVAGENFLPMEQNGGILDYDPKYQIVTELEHDEFGNIINHQTLDGMEEEYTYGYNNSLITSSTINPNGLSPKSTNYVHKPQVGPTEITDPNGRTTTYEYDDFNRLKLIKDIDGNITERYRYHNVSESFDLDASFNTNKQSATVGYGLHFNAAGTVPNIGETEYYWDFGDGTVESGDRNVNHAYQTAGSFEAKLTMLNPEFKSDTQTKTISISDVLEFDLCISGPSTTYICGQGETLYGPCTPQNTTPYQTQVKVQNKTGGCSNVSYNWTYKKSTSYSFSNLGTNSQSVVFPTQQEAGTYIIKCTITDGCGTSSERTVNVFYDYGEGCDGGDGDLPHKN